MKTARQLADRGCARRGSRGFTLIELMIVVAAIAILASIAVPTYNEAVRKSRRGQAKADLVEYAQLAERYHSINRTYVGFALPANKSPREAGSVAQYTLVLNPAATQSTFTIEANAATNDQKKDSCGDLSVNQAGRKTNSSGSLSNCW